MCSRSARQSTTSRSIYIIGSRGSGWRATTSAAREPRSNAPPGWATFSGAKPRSTIECRPAFDPIIGELRAAGRHVDADALVARAALILDAN
jgi:hypothetical protein